MELFNPKHKIMNNNSMNFKKYLMHFALVFALAMVWGQSWGQKTWDGGGDGVNWSSANNWNPNGVPALGDAVTISNSGTLSVTVDGNYSCNSLALTYSGNNNGTITLSIPATRSLSVTNGIGYINNNNGGENVNLDVAGGTLSCAAMTFNDTGVGTDDSYLSISNASSVVNVSGNITMSGIDARRTYILFTANGTLNIAGGFVTNGFITSTSGGGNPAPAPTSGIVNYNNAGVQTVWPTTYYNLQVSGSGTKTLGGNTIVNSQLTLTAGTLAVDVNTLSLNGPTIAGTPSNLATTAFSSLSFGGSSTGINIPSSVADLNNLTLNNNAANAQITMNSNITLAAGGTLTLTRGDLVTGSNYIAVTNTAVGAIAGNSANSYIYGTLRRTLPILTSSGIYNFPIGEATTYNAYLLESITTTAVTVIETTVTSSPAATTGDGTTIGGLLPRNWHASVISGAFTDANIRLTDATVLGNVVGVCATQTGAYTSIGGTVAVGSTVVSIAKSSLPNYFAIGSTLIKTFYSYQNGNWTDKTTWTIDPSGTTNVNNYIAGSDYPKTGDIAYILNGRTVTVDANTQATTQLNIEYGGVLNLAATTGHNFGIVSGQGLIRINSVTFPGGTFTNFVSSTGGTVEYYDVTGNLPAQTNYNNLLLTNSTTNNYNLVLTNPSNPVAYNINGYFKIQQTGAGTLTNTLGSVATNVINLTVYGDYTVGAGCSVLLGAAFNGLHTINLYGNFSNNGTFDINDNTDYLNNTNGAAILTFFGSTDNTVLVNTTTAFYAFRVNKGVDQTYIVSITGNASGCDPFKGYDAYDNIGNLNGRLTISIINGTCRLGSNLNIANLTGDQASGFFIGCKVNGTTIDGTGCLWIDGATVNENSGYIAVYGKLRLSAGTLDATGDQMIFRQECQVLVEGTGVLTLDQIRPSTSDLSPKGSYIQTGGIVNAQGNNGTTDYPSFCVPYPTQSFKMTGGVLNVNRAQTGGTATNGGILINCNNYEVTGGTVNVTSANSNFTINSIAPFYNLNLYRSANNVQLANQNWRDNYGTYTVNAQPLIILNKLYIDGASSTVFNANGNNVTVGGDFIIPANATYTPGANTTKLNGVSGQEFQINGTITSGLQNLTLSNTSATVLTATTVPKTLTINGVWTISSLCSIDDNSNTIVAKGNVFNSGTHSSSGSGKAMLNGTATQQISGDGNGIFGNLELNNSVAAGTDAAKFYANQIVTKTLTLSSGILNIDIYKLSLYDNPSSSIVVASPGANKMIKTAGNQSDGGIMKVYSSTGNSFTFPIGTSSGYSPAVIAVTASTYGNILVKPVNGAQPYAKDSPAGHPLLKYWKVSSEYFAGVSAVTQSYYYNIPGELSTGSTESNYESQVCRNFQWYTPDPLVAVDLVNHKADFTTAKFGAIIDGDYTAGQPDAFLAIVKFYSKKSGNWVDGNSATNPWSNISNLGTDNLTTSPGPDNPVIIGDGILNHTITITTSGRSSGSLILNSGSVLDLGTTTGHNFGALPNQVVGGAGKLRISRGTSDGTAEFPAGDFGAFIGNAGGTVEYYTSGFNLIVPPVSVNTPTALNLTTYNNLNLMATSGNSITMPDINMTVFKNLTVGSSSFTNSVLLNSTSAKSLTINNNLNINGGSLQFNNINAQTVTVGNNVTIASGATFEALNNANAVCANTLTVSGNLTNNGTLTFLAGTRYCDLIFKGNTDNSFTGTTGVGTTLNMLTINKGTTQNSVLTMDLSGTLNTLTNSWLTISNGTFRFAVPSKSITLTNVAANTYTIPSTACLSINATGAIINIGNNANDLSDLLLSGKLEVKNGTINIGRPVMTDVFNNDIEYASAGSPEISITGGFLNVNGQIRDNYSNNAGAIIYNQSGGDVTIWGHHSLVASTPTVPNSIDKAKLMIYNQGSIFNMSGGNIIIKTGGGAIFNDLYLRPSATSVTGGTIKFDAALTGADQTTMTMDADVPLFNLIITGTTYFSKLTLKVDPLILLGSLTIDASNSFITSNLNVNIGSNFTNSGTYTPGTNTTTFNGNGLQDITCNNATTFKNLTINKNSGTADLLGTIDPIVSSTFSLSNGIFDTKDRNFYVYGDVVNSGTHVSTGIGTFFLQGSSKQYISGNGFGSFAKVTINNSNGIELSNDISITRLLTFQSGMLYIDKNLLTFTETAPIPSGYDASKFITTSGVASDAGIRKIFTVGTGPFSFIYPIGTLASGSNKFTPVSYTLTGISGTTPYIQVRPINSKHLATTAAAITELKYYWNVTTSAGFAATAFSHIYTYLQSDVQGTESSYFGGRLPISTAVWQHDGTVDYSNHNVTFTNFTYISGDYTAGELPEFGTIDTYYSRNATSGGNWTDPNSWSITGHGGASNGTYPQGNPVIIASGHTITSTANGCSSINLQLLGRLDLLATNSHNFISMNGSGWLRFDPNISGAFVFPGGDFTPFMNTSGSTVEYSSTGGVTISPVISIYQNLYLSGGGIKSLANVDLLIQGNLTLASTCGQFTNAGYNKNIIIYKDWLNNTTTPYIPGSGTVTFSGSTSQTIAGTGTISAPGESFNNVIVNNSAGLSLSRNINIAKDLTINSGGSFSAIGSSTVSIQGNWVNNSTTTFSSGSTVNFNGTLAQSVSAVSGETFNNLTIGNPTGLTLNCNTTVSGNIDFTSTADSRKLMIGANLLNLSSTLGTISNAGSNKFIQTNGLAGDAGIIKSLTSPYNFTFPIGVSTKYTPAQFSETSAGQSGTIKVIPVNSKHPYANNNLTDELKFYWIVSTMGLVPVNVTHTYTFVASDALPSTASYVSGRFLSNQWTPVLGGETGTSIAGSNLIFTSKNYIDGEFTCGVSTNFGILNTYYSRDHAPLITTGADWRTLSTWSTLGHSDDLHIPNTLPNANSVIIKTGHKVVSYDPGINISNLTLNGDLQLNATASHDFGSVTGTGKLSLKNNVTGQFVLPTANLTSFTSATGGTIEYDGAGDLPAVSTYNNLLLSGIGTKNIPNQNLILNGNLQIAAGQLNNGFGIDITIKKNWIDNVSSGGFTSLAGKVSFNGTIAQSITSTVNTKFYNLEINNSNGLTLINPVEITNNLILTLGKINTTLANSLTLSNSNSNIVSGAGLGTTSFVNGPLKKNIGATGGFTFPIGVGNTYGPATLSNADADVWQAQYYLGGYNSSSAYFADPIIEVSNTENWIIKTTSIDGNAIATLPYGSSGIISKWVVLDYNNPFWTNTPGSTINTANGTVSSNAQTTFTTATDKYFTVGSTNLTKWIGGISVNWFDPNNWSTVSVPTSTDNVKISYVDASHPLHFPDISTTGPAICNNITVENNAILVVSGTGNLDVYGNWVNNTAPAINAVSMSNTSTVSFKGTTAISGTAENTFGNIYINGSLTGPSGNMNITGNWTNAGASNSFSANSTSTVVFRGATNQTIQTANVETFNNVTINSGANVSISSASYVTLNTLVNNGTLTLKSDAARTASMIQTIGSVQATVERFVAGNKWHFMFAPLSAIPTTIYKTEGTSTNYNLYSYLEPNADYWNATSVYGTTGWAAEYSNTNLPNLKGYIFNRYGLPDKTYVQTGGNLWVGPKVFTISKTNHAPATIGNGCINDWNYYDGWNLVGNPYASAINWDLVDKTNIEDVVYCYDGTQGKYAYYGIDPYSGIGISVNNGSKYIPSGQGFMVKSKGTGTTFTLKDADRVHNAQPFWKSSKSISSNDTKSSLTDNQSIAPNFLRLQINSGTYTDESVVRSLPAESGVTDNHDGNFDARKMFAWDKTVPQIFTANADFSNVFAINSMTEVVASKQVPVGLYVGTAGNYSIDFSQNTFDGIHVYLEDKVTNTWTNIRTTPSYAFNSAVGTFTARFVLHFNQNHAPVANNILEKQVVDEEVPFIFISNVNFTDEDQGDIVTCTASYENGNPLPAWLKFDATSHSFSGTPSNNDVGTYTIKLTGTDLLNAQTSTNFILEVRNVNDSPVLSNAIVNQTTNEDAAYSFNIPANTFTDIDAGDILTYTAKIPSWMQFDPATGNFSGTPSNSDVGSCNITIMATDNFGANVSDVFSLEVVNVNDAPILNGQVPDQAIEVNTSFDYTLDQNLFVDIDFGDEITYTAKLADGSVLPSWLNFDGLSRRFTGTAIDLGDLSIVLLATDKFGASASDEFMLSVKNATGIGTLNTIEVSIYPNPTKGRFFVETSSFTGEMRLIVRNNDGKTVFEQKGVRDTNEINLTGFADGVYFIELTDGIESKVHKIVLNK